MEMTALLFYYAPPPSPRDLQCCLKVRPVGSACARHRAPPRYTKCACGRTLTDHRSLPLIGGKQRPKIHQCGISRNRLTLKSSHVPPASAVVAADWLQDVMPPCRRQVEIDMRVDLWPARGTCGVSGDNSAATAKWRWTCSHVADAAPEWPALLAATTTATLILRADPSYPTVALFHVSLTLRKI